MSDLAGAGPVSAPVSNGRTHNGGSRAATGAGPVPQHSSSGVRTPTDIMRDRLDRERKKKAERERDEEEKRRAQEESERRPIVGPTPDSNTYRRSGDATTRRPAGEGPVPATETDRNQGDRVSSSAVKANPTTTTYVPRTATDTTAMPQTSSAQPRGSSISQGQPRTTHHRKNFRVASAPYSTQQQPSQTRQNSSAAVDSQAQAEPSTSAAGLGPRASREQTEGAQPRTTNTSSFPHAFERWEQLSSHWEGLTSFWIRRLGQNSNEMNREPLNQQMARQVTDLSAAGANLFHAVVELQRLRASSERKFQRWFFDTRAEQERAQEVQGGLENQLRMEREARADAVADVARLENEKNSSYQMKATAEQLVKEMRRELQISKEEARRAWEELGRREQEERDRTTSLRNGEPTLVGGVQVVPMMQGVPNPQGVTTLSSVQSTQAGETDEPGYTTYDPARSETDTDPFTEGGRGNTAQPPYQQSFASPVATPSFQPPQQASNTSSAAARAARVELSSSLQKSISAHSQTIPTSASSESTYLRYGPTIPSTQSNPSSFYQHEGPTLHEGERTSRNVEPDAHSYGHSVDTLSEEDYELNDNGELRRDAQGRPIPTRGGLGSEDSDEYDVHEQQERERINGQRYGSAMSGVEYGSGPTGTSPNRPQTGGRGDLPYISAPGPGGQTAPVDYSGSGYGSGLGWEGVPRHHHPTRLSDVLEEDERSRTSASRASQTSRGFR